MSRPSPLFDKLWSQHVVADVDGETSLLYIDRVFLHERTGGIALQTLEQDGRRVRCPERVFCTVDHIVDTFPNRSDETLMPGGKAFIQTTREAARRARLRLFDIDDPAQGIVHVISPEQGIVLPGATVVCPDSHTCTQGALGALAWGIGSSEAEHVLATQTLLVKRPQTMRIVFNGVLSEGVTAKDLILWLIARLTAGGGRGHALEFAGDAVRALDIEARLTLCNMAVEFAAFTGIVAPDDVTFEYLAGRPYAPRGAMWDAALEHWRTLRSDDDAVFDREFHFDVSALGPMVTWGVNPQHAVSIDDVVPAPASDSATRQGMERALTYMDLQPGQRIEGTPIDAAFIGSCTNSRLSDLRAAARVLRGRKVAQGVRAICVPGSMTVKRDAEAEGLDRVFLDAGFEWRASGCSMCFYAGGESFGLRERVISTTNRNFESRQGPQTRTHLASPVTVAASAVTGSITDPRRLLSAVS
ncbi:MAG TPA: 3-isopropylmalate dehydratase large subunit [Steroidobacter sp.]|uniref:3-isopropylmalate dehydratase large subunit n=1 Tax=Steroidobacter sp. TaxID=1978227 RepID=UPI002EDB2428